MEKLKFSSSWYCYCFRHFLSLYLCVFFCFSPNTHAWTIYIHTYTSIMFPFYVHQQQSLWTDDCFSLRKYMSPPRVIVLMCISFRLYYPVCCICVLITLVLGSIKSLGKRGTQHTKNKMKNSQHWKIRERRVFRCCCFGFGNFSVRRTWSTATKIKHQQQK